MKVAAVVVSHQHAEETAHLLAALLRQVDELVVVANVPGSVPDDLPPRVVVIHNERPLGFAANVNKGIARTRADLLLICNPDTTPEPHAVHELERFAEAHPRAGIMGPRMHYPDGTWQPSRRRFPTVGGTIVRRTPLRYLFEPMRWQRRHYMLNEQPTEPVRADWMLGGFLLLRREMIDELGGFDEGYRLYGEDIDLCYRAMRAGWERWYLPSAIVTHRHDAWTDRKFLTRRTWWHWAGIVRFVSHHPEALWRRHEAHANGDA